MNCWILILLISIKEASTRISLYWFLFLFLKEETFYGCKEYTQNRILNTFFRYKR
jgi:hypothetical protein